MDELRLKFEANHQYLDLTISAGDYTNNVTDQCWALYKAHAAQLPRPEIKIGTLYDGCALPYCGYGRPPINR